MSPERDRVGAGLEGTPEARRAGLACFFGSLLEYYDCYIFATAAALVFSKVIFPADSPASPLLALSTFAVAFVARPLGGLFFGHLGDTAGRKRAMIIALSMMGVATVLIGFIPSYDQIGIAAPILLVVLRLLQGISAGGEVAGASALTIEQAPDGRRGWFGSWITTGVVSGFIVASLVFLPITALPQEDMLAWGWRIPFWSSALVLVVAYVIRRRLEEPEVFADVRDRGRTAKMPLATVVRDRWQEILRVAGCNLFVALQPLLTVFGLAYVTTTTDISANSMLWVWISASVVALGVQLGAGLLSDRIGRRPVFVSGCVGLAASILVFFAAVDTGSLVLVTLAGILTLGVFISLANGVYPAFYAEMFDVRVRYTGLALGTQIGLVVAGFVPAAAQALLGVGGLTWILAGLLGAVLALVAAASALTARETHRVPLRELGVDPGAERDAVAAAPVAGTP